MINNQFLHYETQAAFEADRENIADTSIVFVEDSGRIYTHGEQYGSSVKNELGDDPEAGISQKITTEAINAIWKKIDEITGENSRMLVMTITPNYYLGDSECTAHITATAETGMFEEITLYVNDEVVAYGEGQSVFQWDVQLHGTSTIMCKAKILGQEYTAKSVVYNYRAFYIGAGQAYSDIMDEEHLVKTLDTRSSHDVSFNEGDRLYIIIEKGLKESFMRADMNGFEIPFTETIVTVDGTEYVVFESVN